MYYASQRTEIVVKDIHDLVVKLKDVARELGKTPTRDEFMSLAGVSDWSLRKIKFGDIVKASGLPFAKEQAAMKSAMEEINSEVRPPRILYFDIELVGMEVKTYTLYPKYISPKNILKDWSIISYAAMFEGEDKIYYLDQRYAQDKRDDRQLIEGLHSVLSQADILVGHNSDRFDIKRFNTKAAKYGLDPLPEMISYDTLKIVKKYFSLSSNALWFVAQYFGLKNAKSEHGKFPGDTLWDECMAGNLEAWEECEAYNKQDVLVTQELFKYLAKYDPRINFQAFFQKPTCSCGSQQFYKDKTVYRKQGRFRVFRCIQCYKPYTGKENLIDKDLRKGFFK